VATHSLCLDLANPGLYIVRRKAEQRGTAAHRSGADLGMCRSLPDLFAKATDLAVD